MKTASRISAQERRLLRRKIEFIYDCVLAAEEDEDTTWLLEWAARMELIEEHF